MQWLIEVDGEDEDDDDDGDNQSLSDDDDDDDDSNSEGEPTNPPPLQSALSKLWEKVKVTAAFVADVQVLRDEDNNCGTAAPFSV